MSLIKECSSSAAFVLGAYRGLVAPRPEYVGVLDVRAGNENGDSLLPSEGDCGTRRCCIPLPLTSLFPPVENNAARSDDNFCVVGGYVSHCCLFVVNSVRSSDLRRLLLLDLLILFSESTIVVLDALHTSATITNALMSTHLYSCKNTALRCCFDFVGLDELLPCHAFVVVDRPL